MELATVWRFERKPFVGANPTSESGANPTSESGFAPTKGLRSKRQLSNLFTVANSHYQLSW